MISTFNMAQKRMIDKKISVSEQVADLPIEAQLIFTWAIPHADDIGLLPHHERTLKALIIPMVDMTVEKFGFHLESIRKQNLLREVEHNGQKYYHVVKFLLNQTLKRDRQPFTILPVKLPENPEKSWKMIQEIADGMGLESKWNPVGNHLEPEVKRSEVKRREDKSCDAKRAATPSDQAKWFFGTMMISPLPDDGKEFLQRITEKTGLSKQDVWRNVKAFVLYWTEKSKDGKKERWQMQKTFEVDRRLNTWFSRSSDRGEFISKGGNKKGFII